MRLAALHLALAGSRPNTITLGGKTIVTAIERKDLISEIGAPRVITSDAQHARYVSALLELERRGHLTAAIPVYSQSGHLALTTRAAILSRRRSPPRGLELEQNRI
jgi:hypothetical protein